MRPTAFRGLILYGPGGERRQVVRGSAVERKLRARGWSETSSGVTRPPQPASPVGSETARQAREALSTLSPEEWIKDWGEVLCAALDVSAAEVSRLEKVIAAVEEVTVSLFRAVTTVSSLCRRWVDATGYRPGTALEPSIARQRASEVLVREAVSAVMQAKPAVDLLLSTPKNAADRPAPSKESARASGLLEQLRREIGDEKTRELITQARAKLGGSNVPKSNNPGSDEEPN